MDITIIITLVIFVLAVISALVLVHSISKSDAKARAERLKKVKHIKCPNCGYVGGAKNGRSQLIELLLSLIAILLLSGGLWLICWIPLALYYGFVKEWICPKCEFKNVILGYDSEDNPAKHR
ncbi:MAG: hypothetical protein PHV43_02830 [Candidatus Colwellbacteria bacterium]|nr:hypothetical protein [Candidatus Colwellbacteria bacterium]